MGKRLQKEKKQEEEEKILGDKKETNLNTIKHNRTKLN